MRDKEMAEFDLIEDDDSLVVLKSSGLYYEDDLLEQEISEDILKLVPKDMVSQYQIIPLKLADSGLLTMVTSSPEALKNTSQIQTRLKKPVSILISSPENVKQAMNKYYDIESYLRMVSSSETLGSVDDSLLKTKILKLLNRCVGEGVSDLHLIPHTSGIYVKFRVNGFIYDVTEDYGFLADEAKNIINILKGMDKSGQASTAQNRMPNSGHFTFVCNEILVDCRLQTNPIGSSENERQHCNIRFLPQTKNTKTLDNIYVGKDLFDIKHILYSGGSGLYLLSGPVGTGKSTSIESMLDYVRNLYNEQGRDIVIYEILNPIEYKDERNIQVEERYASDETLMLDGKAALRSALRSDPDIINYGEIRDSEDAKVATRACQTGLKVFSTIHAGDCIRTVNRLLDLDVSKMSLLAELKIIVCQRLIGMLCPKCSKEHILTEEEKSVLTQSECAFLEKGNIRERGHQPCTCKDGLIGRTAIPEYIIVTDSLRNALLHNNDFNKIPKILKEHKFVSMWDKGLMMVKNGQAELFDVIQKIGHN